jgi:hypothetical protein
MKINHGMSPKARLENINVTSLMGIIPSAMRDCSTYQFRCAVLSELEFHNEAKQF